MSMKKRIIIMACGLLVLIAAVCAVFVVNQKKQAEAEESSSSIILKNLWENSREDMESITLVTQTDTITLLPNGTNSAGTMQWVLEGHEDWELNSSYQNMVTLAALLPAYKLIEEDVTDESRLAEFGLSPAQSTLTVNFKDGTSRSCYIGNLSSDGDYCFCQVEGDNNVYATNSVYASYASFTKASIRSTEITALDTSNDSNTLTYLYEEKKGSRPIEIYLDEDLDIVNSSAEGATYYTSSYRFKQPYTNTNIEVISDLDSSYYRNLTTPEEVEVVDVDCQDFSQYGLTDEDPEYHEKIITRTGDSEDNYEYTTTDYLFGYTYNDGAYIYFREAGSTLVLGVDASCLDTREFEPFYYVSKLLYINSVYSVSGGTVDYNGRVYNIAAKRSELTQTDSDSSSSSSDRSYSYRINDVLVESDTFREFYRTVMEVVPVYEIYQDTPEYDTSDYLTYTFTFWNGESSTRIMYRMNDYYYVAQVEDDTWFAISIETINSLTDEMDKLDGILEEDANAY